MSNPLGATSGAMSSPFGATHSSLASAGGQQLLLMTEELERTKKELVSRDETIQALRQAIGRLQQQIVYTEHEALEANTALAALSHAAEDDAARNTATIEHLQSQLDELMTATAPTQSQAALMLQVERAIPSMLIEVVYHVGRRADLTNGGGKDVSTTEGGAEAAAQAISAEVMESIRALHPVAAIGQLRLWIRKLMDLDHESLAAMSLGVRHQRQRVHESTARLLRATSMRREKSVVGLSVEDITAGGATLRSSTSMASPQMSSMRRPSPNRKASFIMSDGSAFDDEAVEMLRRRNFEVEEEMEVMRGYVKNAEADVHRVQQAAQLAVFSARRDVGGLRLELREKNRQIEKLLARTNLVDRADLTAAQDEVAQLKNKLHEAVQNGSTALQAKKTESQYLLTEKAEQIRSLESQLERMSRARDHQRELQDALDASRREAATAKQQLARASVKTLVEEKNRHKLRLEEQTHEAQVLKRELEQTQNSLKALQHNNQKMIQQYNDLFEAKLLESKEKAKLQRAQDRDAATQAVSGPNSELNAKYYRTRYLEGLAELKTAQKKLKHLIFLSHHDHLSFHLQRDDLSTQLRHTKSMLPKSTLAQLNGDDDDDDEIIALYSSTGRSGGGVTPAGGMRPPSPGARYSPVGHHRSSSPGSPSDDDAIMKVINNDTSFAAYGMKISTSNRTSPAASRPNTASKGRGPPGGGGGYDVLSPTRSVHSRDVSIVGILEEGVSEQADSYSNPRVSNITAKMSTTRQNASGETSRRTALYDKDMKPVNDRLEDVVMGKATTSQSKHGMVHEQVELRANANAASPAPTLHNPKSNKSIAYLRKTRANEPAGSLSRAMTPVVRPSSALL
jgi:hypothetical protein